MKPLDEADLDMINVYTNDLRKIRFVVEQNNLTCLFGKNTIQDMGLVTFNNEKFILKAELVQPLGDLGVATLKVDSSISLQVLLCSKIMIVIQDSVKQEIDCLVQQGVLIPISEPTPLVVKIAFAHKSNRQSRVCIDP
jgi:hypothetical protein